MPLLSICIATFKRAAYLGETLDSILEQWREGLELVVVDGASPDETPEVMERYLELHPQIVYHREPSNSGVDADFDKAVGYASGTYCWLMSDDDLLVPGAVEKVLAALADRPELVVVNAEVRDRDLRVVLKPSQLALSRDQTFVAGEMEALFAATASYLSFIGGVVVCRAAWLARERAAYYGSLFIHIGVLFQAPPLGRARVLAEPLVRIRYGNAMWTARGFEIWTDLWPRLVWSFDQFSPAARRQVSAPHPAQSIKDLLWYRAIGAYGIQEYRELLVKGARPHHVLARFVAVLPARFVNAAVAMYCRLRAQPDQPMKLYEVERARCASRLARALYRQVVPTATGAG